MAGKVERWKVSARHLCGGEGCYFCDWSNPPMFEVEAPSEAPAVVEPDEAVVGSS